MLPRRYNDIIAFRRDDGDTLAFHARTLEVARVASQVWEVMAKPAQMGLLSACDQDIWREIQGWQSQESKGATERERLRLRSLNIHVAQICNMACNYCAAGGDGTYGSAQKQMNLSIVIPHLTRLLAEVPLGEDFQLNFFGGEPLIYPQQIEAIIHFAQPLAADRGIKLKYRITTNGTLINRATLELLTKYRFHVTVSLDGPASVNDRVRPMRGGRGSTSIVVTGLNRLLERREELSSLDINSVFGSHNLEVHECYGFLRGLAVDSMNFNYSVEDNSSWASEQFIEQMKRVAATAYGAGGELELRRIHFFDNLFMRLDSQVPLLNHCGAGKTFLLLDTEGDVHVCNWFANDKAERVGSGQQVDEKSLSHYAQPLVELNSCQSCWARYVCGGGCMYVNKVASGNKHQSAPLFCQRQKALILIGIDYYEKARTKAEAQ